MKRILFITIGSLSFLIGTAGIYLPGLPVTIFYLTAAYCFARSSEKLYQKMLASKYYQEYVHQPFVKREMTSKKKWRIFLSMGLVFGIAILLVSAFWLKILLLTIYLAHLIGLSWYWPKR